MQAPSMQIARRVGYNGRRLAKGLPPDELPVSGSSNRRNGHQTVGSSKGLEAINIRRSALPKTPSRPVNISEALTRARISAGRLLQVRPSVPGGFSAGSDGD